MPASSIPTLQVPVTPDEALQRLLEGNQRFVAGTPLYPNRSIERRQEVSQGQQPWAVVLSCVDSRVPPEIVLDQGLGDLFVCRTAGQVIDSAVLGSLEFAVEEGAKLAMVIGHQSCGAVKATIQTMQSQGHAEGYIDYLVQAIKPTVQAVLQQPGDVLENAVRANITLEVEQLKKQSSVISHALSAGMMKLVGARYDLNSGVVTLI